MPNARGCMTCLLRGADLSLNVPPTQRRAANFLVGTHAHGII